MCMNCEENCKCEGKHNSIIQSKLGEVTIEGTYNEVIAEFGCIVKSMVNCGIDFTDILDMFSQGVREGLEELNNLDEDEVTK